MNTHDAHARSPRSSRRTFIHSAGVVGLGLASGPSVVSSAAESEERTPTFSTTVESDANTDATPIDSCTLIDEPGEYELVADISFDWTEQHRVDLSRGCILITAEGVTLRGNGHTIEGHGVGNCIAVGHDLPLAPEEASLDPVIEDVVVRGGRHGIASRLSGFGAEIRDVTAVENTTGISFFVDGGTLTNCVIEENERGVNVEGDEVVWFEGGAIDLVNCTITQNDVGGLRVGAFSTARADESRFVANGDGVRTASLAETTTLRRCHICRNAGYGVRAFSSPGMDPELLDDPDRDFPFEHPSESHVDAIENYWGTATGPSSFGDPEEPFTDPETGRPASGDGDAISDGLEPGVANVSFDPFFESPIDDVGSRR